MLAFFQQHRVDPNGNPAGGITCGRGFNIAWQNGPLVDPDGERGEQNGAFVEDIIAAAYGRLTFYQQAGNGKFACLENAIAIEHLEAAFEALGRRTKRREAAGVEGTHGLAPGDEGLNQDGLAD